jgi:hypothetical protein
LKESGNFITRYFTICVFVSDVITEITLQSTMCLRVNVKEKSIRNFSLGSSTQLSLHCWKILNYNCDVFNQNKILSVVFLLMLLEANTAAVYYAARCHNQGQNTVHI